MPEIPSIAIYTAISASVCVGVAAIELLHRYSHASKSTTILLNIPGVSYLLINLSVGAFAALISDLTGAVVFDGDGNSIKLAGVLKAFGTGMAGLAILRSSLATFKNESGETNNLGLSFVLDKLRDLLDKKIDFSQKLAAGKEISIIMQDVDPDLARYDLAMLCLAGIQSISKQDAESLHSSIDAIFESKSLHSRSILIGHALYSVCGLDILRSSVTQLADKIKISSNTSAGVESEESLSSELISELIRIQRNGAKNG